MEILEGIEIKGKALWLKKQRVLIVADLHIGYEESLMEEGISIPSTFNETKREIQELLQLKPKIVIINGDLKHEFGEISRQEWQETLEILDLLLQNTRATLIKGNHDTILEPIAKKKGLKILDFFILDDICILHGHKIFKEIREIINKKIKVLIIAHEHPAVSLHEGIKHEIFKCFLKGRWHNKTLIVMPSFFSIFEGSNIKKEKLLSPFLFEKNIKNFEVYVIDKKSRVYWFGKLKNIF